MKKDIHPKFSTKTKVACSCGAEFETGSTIQDEIRVETCSNCHPFYTGENRILKTSSVDKFYARQKKTEGLKKAA
ncbi:MAG TPA: 50S ribosomal protein L31 [bacterium]|nr:50S ribosomal protein L31 [bacterium]